MKGFFFKVYSFCSRIGLQLKTRFNKNYYLWLNKRIVASHGSVIKVNGPTYLSSNTYLGENANFNGMSIFGQGKVIIGNNFHSGKGCRILTANHNYNGESIPYDSTNIIMNVTIEDNVWLGEYVTILGNITIGEGAIIQAHSVVVNSIPKLAIAGGHPARVFKYRDSEKYYSLKKAQKFL